VNFKSFNRTFWVKDFLTILLLISAWLAGWRRFFGVEFHGFRIISFQPDFVYPSNKKDLDENESIKVINLKLCDCFSSARFSASFGVNGVNSVLLMFQKPHR